MLDVEGSAASLGKTAGKDVAQGKPTFVSLSALPRPRRAPRRCASTRTRRSLRSAARPGASRELADWIVLRASD